MRYIQKIDEFLGLFKKKDKKTIEPNERELVEIELNKLSWDPETYRINDDLTVDVFGNVKLFNQKLTKFPFKFGEVTGDFYCSKMGLETLDGSPRKIGGSFDCSENNLVNLIGGPILVGNNYICSNNKLESLEGAPDEINGNFYCVFNFLKTLQYCPSEIHKNLSIINNELTTLDTVSNVGGDIYCALNDIDPNNTGFMGYCGGKIDFYID